MHAQEHSDPWLRASWFCFHNFRNNGSKDIFKIWIQWLCIETWTQEIVVVFFLTTQVMKIQLNFLLKNIQSILLTLCSWLESSFLFMFSDRVTEQTSSSSIFLLSNTDRKNKVFWKILCRIFLIDLLNSSNLFQAAVWN